MEIKSEAELVILKSISNHGICQFTKCQLPINNLLMFRKSYDNFDKMIAYNEILVNERIKNSKISNFKNIVEYYGSFTENKINLFFEYSEIGSLFDYFRENTQFNEAFMSDINIIRLFLINIVEALIQIHRLGIVHNDIKLDNILVFKDNRDNNYFNFKICDFNNSLFVDADGKIINIYGIDDYYTCPFPFSFEKPNFKLDYWCLGLMLLKLFTKVENFDHNYSQFSDMISIIRNKSYKRKFYWNSTYLKNSQSFTLLEDLIDKLLDFNYEERIDDEFIFTHSFFSVRFNWYHAKFEKLDINSRRKKQIYEKKLIRLKKSLKDLENIKKRNVSLNKLKQRMIKYAKIINKI